MCGSGSLGVPQLWCAERAGMHVIARQAQHGCQPRRVGAPWPSHRRNSEPFAELRKRETAQECRQQTPHIAGSSHRRRGGCWTCSLGAPRACPPAHRQRGNADQEVGTCRQPSGTGSTCTATWWAIRSGRARSSRSMGGRGAALPGAIRRRSQGSGVPRPRRDHRAPARETQEGASERLRSPVNQCPRSLLAPMRAHAYRRPSGRGPATGADLAGLWLAIRYLEFSRSPEFAQRRPAGHGARSNAAGVNAPEPPFGAARAASAVTS